MNWSPEATIDDAAELDGGLAGAAGLEGGVGHGRELGEYGERALVGAVAVGLGELRGYEAHDVGGAQLDLRRTIPLAEVDRQAPVVERPATVDAEVGEESRLDELLLVHRLTPCVCQPRLHF